MINNIKNFIQDSLISIKKITREDVNFSMTFVLISVIILTLDRYGLQTSFSMNNSWFRSLSNDEIIFWAQVYFSSWNLLLFVIIPVIFHFIFPVRQEVNFGLRLKGIGKNLWIYMLILIIILPIVWMACNDPNFYNFYPMYQPLNLKKWMLYELIYSTNFFCVEFFFRGFILFRLKERFGSFAVWIMIIPYSFIHIHKPFPEALGSIVAGIVLGSLALKTKSIWPGVLVHCTVAFSADFFSMIHSGRLFNLLK